VFRRCRVFLVASFRVSREFLTWPVWWAMLSTLSVASFRVFRLWVTSLTSSAG
jgi:hypothetical protein